MTKNQKLAAAALATAVAVWYFHYGSREATLALYPEIDRKIAKKAYRQLHLEILRGEYTNLELNNETLDTLFRAKVALLSYA